METVNKSEEFVLNVCRKSFLSLWCYANPIKVVGEELCDILIVCDPRVIAISVKDILLNPKKDPRVAHDRWQRKAVEDSKRQLYTAARWLKTAPHVIRKDASPGLNLPPQDRRRIHMIAVAIGSRGEAIIASGDEGKNPPMTLDGLHTRPDPPSSHAYHSLQPLEHLPIKPRRSLQCRLERSAVATSCRVQFSRNPKGTLSFAAAARQHHRPQRIVGRGRRQRRMGRLRPGPPGYTQILQRWGQRRRENMSSTGLRQVPSLQNAGFVLQT